MPGVSDRYLTSRHAVVTGGGRGIGAAISERLASLGANLSLMGRDRSKLDAHAALLIGRFGIQAEPLVCDVTDARSVRDAFAAANDRFGVPFVLVNNAGQAEGLAFAEMTRELWDRMLAVNLTGTYSCMRAVLPAMIEAQTGRVINIASTAGLKGYGRLAAYCASKHGVIGLTKAVAMETAKLGVTVNAVCPGYTDTDMAQAAVDNIVRGLGKTPDEALQMIVRTMPRGKLIAPSEVADAVGWLCAPGSDAVTGQAIAVAGGEVM